MRKTMRLVGSLMVAATIGGCGDDGGAVGTCTPGRTVECGCPGGASGVQTCGDDGTFEPCRCSSDMDAGPRDASAADAAGDDATVRVDGGGPDGSEPDASRDGSIDDASLDAGDAAADGGDAGLGDAGAACTPFADECPAGQWCPPVGRDPDTGDPEPSVCDEAGSVAAGDACSAEMQCTEGHYCIDGTCRQVCDPLGELGSPCPSGQACFDDVTGIDFGLCLDACTPFDPDACPSGMWCSPGFHADVGRCVEHGSTEIGSFCTLSSDCVAGSLCLDFGDGDQCRQACYTEAVAGEPGSCSGSDACFALRDPSGDPLYAGTCEPSCDYDAGDPCEDATLTCVPGEMLGTQEDSCLSVPELAEGDDCSAEGLEVGELCAPTSFCLMDGSSAVSCTEMCRVSEGDYGTTGHPDCTRSEATCVDAFSVDALGICS